MNDHEAQRLAAAAHELRPDWPAASVLTLIRSSLIDKPRRDVAVALAWVACEADTKTPKRILETGPWWKAAGADGAETYSRLADRGPWCKDCGTGAESPNHRSGECEFTLWPAQIVKENERAARLAALRAQAAEHTTPPTLMVVRDESTCGADCIRGAGHTGPHQGPPTDETEDYA